MAKKQFTCIVCPIGCPLTVEVDGKNVLSVCGNTCKRGETYAIAECTAPTRMLTTTVRLEGGAFPVLPVKTARPIPKELLFEAMHALNQLTVTAPISIGATVCADICKTGIPVLATREG